MNDETRVRTVAFNIAARFEGGSYQTFQNYDNGIISYGRFQFTLASGALGHILTQFLDQSTSETAAGLAEYESRIVNKDSTLRQDRQLRELLVAAAREPEMRQIQNEVATELYWEPIKQIAILPRNLQTPLAWALLFDIGINFGVGDGFLRMAEREFGAPYRSAINEQQLIMRVAELRKQSHDRQASIDGLPGLRVRGDFWLNLVRQGDWHLQGDEDGNITIKGRPVQVRSPQTEDAPLQELDPAKFYLVPIDDRIRVRNQPVNGAQIGSVLLGDIVEALEPFREARGKVGKEDEWLHIHTPDHVEGFAAAWFFSIYQEPTIAPAPSPEPQPEPQPKPEPVPTPDEQLLLVTPTDDRIRVRTRPADGDPVASLSRGDLVQVIEPLDIARNKIGMHGQWLHIRTDEGAEGYTAAWFYTVYEEAVPEPEPEPTLPAPDHRILYVTPTDDRIRVRSRPVDGDPVATMSQGEIAEVIESYNVAITKIGVEDKWLHISTPDGIVGFTAAWFYAIAEEPTPEPLPTEPQPNPVPEPLPKPPILDQQSLFVTPIEDRVRIRTRPVDGDSIGSMSRGDVAQIIEAIEAAREKIGVQDQWLHIRTDDGTEGFTAAWYYTIFEPKLYITPTEDRIRVRAAPPDGEQVAVLSRGDVAQVIEPIEAAREKIGVQDQWLHIRTDDGTEGFTAAWFHTIYEPGALPQVNVAGINLDLYHTLGTPRPSRLGQLGWVRFLYNVSLDPTKRPGDPARYGNIDLDATFARYHRVLDAYARAGFRILLVFTHETFGEGAGYNWHEMNSASWRNLSDQLAAVAGRIAEQYRERDFVYQIWNEMDVHTGARASVPMPPEDYGYMLAESIKAIRRADPFATVITGGHASGPSSGVIYAQRVLRAMPNGLQPDGIAFHPYGRGPAQSEFKYRHFGLIDEAVQVYGSILPDKPVWITEWGVLNASSEPSHEIARYAGEFIGHLKSRYRNKVATALWFAWGQGMDNGYGIVDRNDNPRDVLTDEFIRL